MAGGLGVGLGPVGAKLEGGKKASSSLEEEMVRYLSLATDITSVVH